MSPACRCSYQCMCQMLVDGPGCIRVCITQQPLRTCVRPSPYIRVTLCACLGRGCASGIGPRSCRAACAARACHHTVIMSTECTYAYVHVYYIILYTYVHTYAYEQTITARLVNAVHSVCMPCMCYACASALGLNTCISAMSAGLLCRRSARILAYTALMHAFTPTMSP